MSESSYETEKTARSRMRLRTSVDSELGFLLHKRDGSPFGSSLSYIGEL